MILASYPRLERKLRCLAAEPTSKFPARYSNDGDIK